MDCINVLFDTIRVRRASFYCFLDLIEGKDAAQRRSFEVVNKSKCDLRAFVKRKVILNDWLGFYKMVHELSPVVGRQKPISLFVVVNCQIGL